MAGVFAAEFLGEAANYVPFVAHRWDFIGIKLYQGNLVQMLRYSEKSAPTKLTEILQGWLNGSRAPGDELAAWIELVKALRSPAVNLGAIARKIEETHVRPLQQAAQQSSRAQVLVTGRGDQVFRDSELPPGLTYQDVMKRQQEGQLIHFPDHTTDAVRDRSRDRPSSDQPRSGPSSDRPHGGPSSDQPRGGPSSDQPHGGPSSDRRQQVPNTTSYGTSTASASVVPDSPYYRHGNQQQGNPHMQTSGGVNPANAEPRKQLVLGMPTSSGTTEEHPQHSDNPHFTSSPSSLSTPSGGSWGKSPAISPTNQSTPGDDDLSPSPKIQELLDKRMMIDDPDDRRCLLQLAKRLPKWRYFGLYLNLPESTLAEMDRSGVDADDKAVTMLMQWVKESQTGTRATLVQCLAEVGAVDLMHELKHTGTIKPRDPVK